MLKLHPEYVMDQNNSPKAVLLSFQEWKKILEDIEELEDIRAYDAAKALSQESIPFDQAIREIKEGYAI